jgi:pimeloyl-ACP methyl ester carboxylesterase
VGRGQVVAGRLVVQVDVGCGPPLVLVHGLSASSRWWRRNIPDLARHFHVYAVDLPGFGTNRARPLNRREARFTLHDASRCLVDWMDETGIERASIIGHSMGGYIAVDLAAEYPEHVDRIVLVDAALLPAGATVRRSTTALFRSLARIRPDFIPVLAVDAVRAGPLTALRASQQLHARDLRPKLASIHAPTLVVWGDNDLVVPVDVAEEIAAAVPGARLSVIEHAGHSPMWDRADDFNRLVLAFLSDAPMPSGEPEAGSAAAPNG